VGLEEVTQSSSGEFDGIFASDVHNSHQERSGEGCQIDLIRNGIREKG
jgi:hypothetical protein